MIRPLRHLTLIAGGLVVGVSLLTATMVDARTPTKTAPQDDDCIPSVIDEAWLVQQETAGGHTLDRHVNRNADELAARLQREQNIPAASSFRSTIVMSVL